MNFSPDLSEEQVKEIEKQQRMVRDGIQRWLDNLDFIKSADYDVIEYANEATITIRGVVKD